MEEVEKIVLPFVIALVGSQALFGFAQFIIQFLVTRADMKQNFGKKLDDLNNKVDRNQAILCRTHILRFSDEIRNHGAEFHSEESYRQQIIDCDTYDAYCRDHPDFSNGLTIIASKFIRDEFERLYKERRKENDNQ